MVLKQDRPETIFASIASNSKNCTFFNISKVSEEISNFLISDLVGQSSDFDGNLVLLLDYKDKNIKNISEIEGYTYIYWSDKEHYRVEVFDSSDVGWIIDPFLLGHLSA